MEQRSPRRAVVLGGAGFLGRRVVELLAGEVPEGGRPRAWPRYDAVHVVDRAPSHPFGALKNVTYAVGDVCDRESLRGHLRGAHAVFHLASVVDVSLRPGPRI